MRSLGTCQGLCARPRVRGAITTRLGSNRSPSLRGCSNGCGISGSIDFKKPIGSLSDIGGMGRPKNFNREGVLEKALPVFWRRGFVDASVHELELATGVNKSGLSS